MSIFIVDMLPEQKSAWALKNRVEQGGKKGFLVVYFGRKERSSGTNPSMCVVWTTSAKEVHGI